MHLIPQLGFRTQTNCPTEFEFEFGNSAQFENSLGLTVPYADGALPKMDVLVAIGSETARAYNAFGGVSLSGVECALE